MLSKLLLPFWQKSPVQCCILLFLFAMPLEVILSKNGSIFSHIYLLLHFLEGKCIICHLIAYYSKIGENVKNLYFGCHGKRFLQ